MITFACLSFVLYQSHKCLLKYYSSPKSADVSIQKAESHPEVTLCPKDLTVYNDYLKKCNLSNDDYFVKHKWIGNDSCKDPKILWNTMVGNINDWIMQVFFKANDKWIPINMNDLDNFFRTLDAGLHGRCYTWNLPKILDFTSIHIVFKNHKAKVHIHPPGEFFWSESAVFNMYGHGHTKIKLLYETFEVLDYNGDICIKSLNESKDDCILNAIQQESKLDIGCTVPYIPDKSQICVNPIEATKARLIFQNITEWNQTKAQKLCPKTCLQYIISVGSKNLMKANTYNTCNTYLTVDFPKFIKVSRTYLSYTNLELIAEVGGYVGLFLGVSINQISDLFRIIVGKLSSQL